jgi:hypothetical protein
MEYFKRENSINCIICGIEIKYCKCSPEKIETEYKKANQHCEMVKTITDHKNRVNQYMKDIGNNIFQRGEIHDDSKLSPQEFPFYLKATDDFKKYPYGTDGYELAKQSLGPALENHNKNNRHHIEHFNNGIEGMDLVDLIELICDWKSATLNFPDKPGSMKLSMEIAVEKYNISPQLASILQNTIKNYNLE